MTLTKAHLIDAIAEADWLLPIQKLEGERRMLKVDQYDYIRTAHRD